MNTTSRLAVAVIRASVLGLLVLASSGCATRRTPLEVSVYPPVQLCTPDTEVDGLRLDLPVGVNGVVRGLDIGFAGVVTQQMAGAQLQVCAGMAGEADGIQVAMNPILALNRADRMRGMQVAGFITPVWVGLGGNSADDMKGVQVATGWNTAGTPDESPPVRGGQASFYCNRARSDATVLQATALGANLCNGNLKGGQVTLFAGCNYAKKSADGLQAVLLGANVAHETCRGVQLGAVNTAAHMDGIQVGLVNYCRVLHGVQVGLANVSVDQTPPFMPIVNARF